jgi:hypothetical protein
MRERDTVLDHPAEQYMKETGFCSVCRLDARMSNLKRLRLSLCIGIRQLPNEPTAATLDMANPSHPPLRTPFERVTGAPVQPSPLGEACLPSSLGEKTVRPCAHAILPCLIEDK